MNRMQALEIERACERLVVTYTHLVDFGEAEQVAELFAADALWQAGEIRFEGRDAVRAMFRGRQEMTQRRSRHVCTNGVVDVVDEDHATGLVYLQLYRPDFEPGARTDSLAPDAHPVAVGEYHDQFVRTAEGWRFAERRAELAFGAL